MAMLARRFVGTARIAVAPSALLLLSACDQSDTQMGASFLIILGLAGLISFLLAFGFEFLVAAVVVIFRPVGALVMLVYRFITEVLIEGFMDFLDAIVTGAIVWLIRTGIAQRLFKFRPLKMIRRLVGGLGGIALGVRDGVAGFCARHFRPKIRVRRARTSNLPAVNLPAVNLPAIDLPSIDHPAPALAVPYRRSSLWPRVGGRKARASPKRAVDYASAPETPAAGLLTGTGVVKGWWFNSVGPAAAALVRQAQTKATADLTTKIFHDLLPRRADVATVGGSRATASGSGFNLSVVAPIPVVVTSSWLTLKLRQTYTAAATGSGTGPAIGPPQISEVTSCGDDGADDGAGRLAVTEKASLAV